jgi:hypothetical protein
MVPSTSSASRRHDESIGIWSDEEEKRRRAQHVFRASRPTRHRESEEKEDAANSKAVRGRRMSHDFGSSKRKYDITPNYLHTQQHRAILTNNS